MANVLIEEAVLQGWADTVREKTGTTDKMKPSVLLEQTQTNWGTGGGGESTDLVKYVTFLAEDGSQLYKMPVLKGDTCKDPVSHGDISKPTKESTNTTHYTYSGWTSEVGGTADSSILQNITADKTVYVAFATSIRYYTVTFYDDDATTVLHTVNATYGADVSNYVPKKSGYMFIEWQPSPTNVTTDMNCYAVWEEGVSFAKSSWADIAAISESGEAANYFAIGDKRTVIYYGSDGEQRSLELVIAGFSHDDLADGSGKAGMTIVSNNLMPEMQYRGLSDNQNALQTIIRYEDGLACKGLITFQTTYLPSDLLSVIKTVKKPCKVGGSSTLYDLECQTFMLSFNEINKPQSGYTAIGTPYEGFSSGAISTTQKNNSLTAKEWHLRDVTGVSDSSFRTYYSLIWVSTTGAVALPSTTTNGMNNYYARFGFCI